MSVLVQPSAFASQRTISFALILLGWFCSILLVPTQGYYAPGALAIAATALSLGLLGGVAISAIRSPASLFRTEHILLVGIVYWILLDAIQGAYSFSRVSRDGVLVSFNGVAMFALALVAGSSLSAVRPIQLRERVADEPSARFLTFAAILCFALGMLRVVVPCNFNPVCIGNAFFAPRLQAAWYTTNVGNLNTILTDLRYFGFLVPALTVALYLKEGRVTARTLLLGLLSMIFLAILFRDGGRRSLGMVVGSAGLLWVLLQKPLRLRHFVAMAIFAGLLLLVMQVMVAWRYIGIFTAIEQGASLETKARSGIAVDTNLLYMGYIADLVPRDFPHTGLTGITYIFTAGIPRSILPASAPIARGFPLVQLMGLRVSRGYSWTCSAVGDLYLIGGYLAIVIGGLIFGVLANCSSRLLYQRKTLTNRFMYAMATMTLFVTLRAVHEILIFGLSVLALWGVLRIRHVRFNVDTLPRPPAVSAP